MDRALRVLAAGQEGVGTMMRGKRTLTVIMAGLGGGLVLAGVCWGVPAVVVGLALIVAAAVVAPSC